MHQQENKFTRVIPRNLRDLYGNRIWKWVWDGLRGNPQPQRDVEIIAYVRFGAEELTFKQCLESLLPTIRKGVLVYHRLPTEASELTRASHARSVEIARAFVAQHSGFKLIEYPHVVYGAHNPLYYKHQRIVDRIKQGLIATQEELEQLIPAESCLDSFYRFTWERACELATAAFPYIMKVDADHVYHAPTIASQLEFLRNAPSLVGILYLPKFNVFYSRTRDQLFVQGMIAVNDHYIQLIDTCAFKMKIDSKLDWKTGAVAQPQAAAYEQSLFEPPASTIDYEQIERLKHCLTLQNLLTRSVLQEKLPVGGYVRAIQQRYGVENVSLWRFTPKQVSSCLRADNEAEWLPIVRDLPHSSLSTRNGVALPSYNEAQALTPHPAYSPQIRDYLNDPELVQLKSRIVGKDGKVKLRKLARETFFAQWRLHVDYKLPLEQIPLGTGSPVMLSADSEIHWINSLHFFLQKHLQNTQAPDFTDEELAERGLMRFKCFLYSDLCRELQMRCPSFTPDSWFLQEEQLLQLARTFYQDSHPNNQ